MIVLWRRIRKAVGGIGPTEWALLAIETFAVVAGILIAFELEQWSERREKRAAQAALLDRLVDEAEQSVAFLIEHRDGFDGWRRAARTQLDILINEDRCPPEGDMSFARNLPSLHLPTSAYDEMAGTGGLSILPRARERRAVADYQAARNAFAQQLQFARSLATGYDFGDWDRMGFVYTFDPAKPAGSSYNGRKVHDGDCADETFKGRMASAMYHAEVVHEFRAALAAEAIEMCAVLADAAGRQCRPGDQSLTGDDLDLAAEALEGPAV
ncbi:hypothetical protein [Sphingomicrobium arenosum]|uniref:hypothetical protein n=1 Tax=Sphingomicrobium arenosum TaxID=2233861 RepID=UPI002240F327|nr:hypothetical protein [Sphingomicrobium arenosum]